MANQITSLKLMSGADEIETGEQLTVGKTLRLRVDGTSDDAVAAQRRFGIAVRIRYKVRGIPHTKTLTFISNASGNVNFTTDPQRFRSTQPGPHSFQIVGWHRLAATNLAAMHKKRRIRIKMK